MTPGRRPFGPDGRPGDTSARGAREDRAAEARSGIPGAASGVPGFDGVVDPFEADPPAGIDPELIEDLGPALEMRGDVVEGALEEALNEAAEMRDAALRAQAEFDNFRKRTMREREEERKRAAERLVVELIPAIDNLERAIEHTTADNDINHLVSGVTSVHAQIVGVLAREGVTVIDPVGQPFDPMTQQAVSQQEDPSVPEGTVVAAFQKGYEMGGRTVRPAMVVVSTGGPRREE